MDSYALGQKLAAAGRLSEAIGAFERALADRPDDIRTLFALGNTARALGMGAAAEQFYRRVLELEPGRLEAVVNLANLLRSQGAFEAAAALVRPVLAQTPDEPELLLTLGSILRETDALPEATDLYRATLEKRPASVPALVNLADLLADGGDDGEALKLYDRALKLEPNNAQARLNRAILHLARGNLKDGWKDYAARLKVPGKVPLADHGLKRWDGSSFKRTRLLITAEQGVGDHLMFASMIPELAARATAEGGSLLLECEPRLRPLFARSFPGVATHDWDLEKREGVLHTHYGWLKLAGGANAFLEMGSLPKVLRKTIAAFPSPNVFLAADPDEAARWRSCFESLPRPWVAVCWRSGSTGGARAVQYAALKDWGGMLREMPGTAIVAQYDARDDETATLSALSGRPVFVPQGIDQKQELDRVAAMLSVCDAVISAPTAVSWLSAGLGVPTFKALYDLSWPSFGTNYEPFAPAARCLMPAQRGDWSDVMTQALTAIRALPA
jgi:tetratricopeptide (TPR) repeat protein